MKKILSFGLALSMFLAAMPGMVANATTVTYDSITVDLMATGIANGDRLTTNNLVNTSPSAGIWGADLLSLLTGTGELNAGKAAAWKTAWENVTPKSYNSTIDTKTNTLTFNGIDYIISVPFAKGTNNTTASTGPKIIYSNHMNASVSPYYNTLDIPDGYYNGVSMLGGGYTNANGIIFRYVYEDGSKSIWQHIWCHRMSDYVMTGETGRYTTEGLMDKLVFTRYVSGGTQDTANYIHVTQMQDTDADPTKKMVSIDFIASNATLFYNSAYDYTNSSGQRPTSGSTQNYSFQMIGMTMLRDHDLFINQLKTVWAEKPATYTGSAADRTWIAGLKAKYALVDASSLTAENLTVYNEITAYIADIGVMDENHVKIEEIYTKLTTELPLYAELTTASITADNTAKLRVINDLEAARAEEYDGVTIDADHQAMLTALADYNTEYMRLKIEISETNVTAISAIIDAAEFPTLEDLENPENFTVEVQDAIKEVEDLLDNIVYEEVSSQSQAICDEAEQYVAKLKAFYGAWNTDVLSEVNAMLAPLPAANAVTYTPDENEAIYKLSKTWDETKAQLYADYLTTEQASLVEKADAYKALVSNLPAVSSPISPEVFSNMTSAFSTVNGGIADETDSKKHTIDGAKWIKEDVWDNVWSVDAAAGYGENTLTYNGVTYKIRVADGDKAILSGYTASNGTDIGYDEIDIEDGLYTGVSFIGGGNKNATKVGVAFKYKDEETVTFCETQAIRAVYNPDSSYHIEVPSIAAGVEGTMYLHQYTFTNPHPEKVVEKILIPYRNTIINADGTYEVGPTSGVGSAWLIWGRWMGITMLQGYSDYCTILEEKFAALETVTEEDRIDALKEVDEIVKNAQNAGINVTNIEGYDVYSQQGASYPRIMGCKINSDLENCNINITFATDVRISKDQLTIYNSKNEEVDFTFSYADNTATLAFENDMNYEEEYEIVIADSVAAGGNILGKAVAYNFNIPSPVEMESFTAVEGTDKVTVSLTFKNNMTTANDVLVIVVVGDESGKAVDSYAVSGTLTQDGTISITNKELNAPAGSTLKVLCWDNVSGLNTIHKFDIE